MEKKKILVVDDEHDLVDVLQYNLNMAGFQAEAAFSAERALEMIGDGKTHYDLLLLDVMMPGLSGFELAEHLKYNIKTKDIPIIFLTAKDSVEDALQGFSHGADDYIRKPFSIREVVARINAVLTRAKTEEQEKGVLRYEDLVMDLEKKHVTADGQEVQLTRTEYELLKLLLGHQGEVQTRQQLLEGAWPEGVIVTDRAVDVNITRLRKKLNGYAQHIVSKHGFGYVFKV